MFDRIAGVYDAMNSAMTAGLHHEWRRRAVDVAEVGPGSDALDLCCGTGDLALALRERIGPDGRVVGSDFSEHMLDLARRKSAERGLPVEFGWADALDLPYGDASFDAVTIGFGARNLADLDRGLAEMARVVRPGDAWSSSRSPGRTASRWRASTRSGSTTSSRGSASSPATRRPTATCRSLCAPSRSRESLPPGSTPPGFSRSAGSCSRAGSSRSTAPRGRRSRRRRLRPPPSRAHEPLRGAAAGDGGGRGGRGVAAGTNG